LMWVATPQISPHFWATCTELFKRHGITRKNTDHAVEQEREDVKAARLAWSEKQLDLDPDRLLLSASANWYK